MTLIRETERGHGKRAIDFKMTISKEDDPGCLQWKEWEVATGKYE